MEIHHVIVHKINSEQYSSKVTTIQREKEITLPNKNADNLLGYVIESFNKDVDIAYAGFDEKSWFPAQLNSFNDSKLTFYDFSCQSLTELASKMQLVAAATGGYLTIFHYTENNNNFLMVILLKDREGIVINQNLEIEIIQSLNLERLHFAAKININKWKNPDLEEQRNHISFLKGKGREYVVDYFRSFLGIDETMYVDPHRNNLELVNAIKEYASQEKDFQKRNALIDRVHSYLDTQTDNNEPIALGYLASLASPENPNLFVSFLHDAGTELPGEFPGDKKVIEKLIRYHIRTKEYTLTFLKKAVDDGIFWINDDGNLEISYLTPKLRYIVSGEQVDE